MDIQLLSILSTTVSDLWKHTQTHTHYILQNWQFWLWKFERVTFEAVIQSDLSVKHFNNTAICWTAFSQANELDYMTEELYYDYNEELPFLLIEHLCVFIMLRLLPFNESNKPLEATHYRDFKWFLLQQHSLTVVRSL